MAINLTRRRILLAGAGGLTLIAAGGLLWRAREQGVIGQQDLRPLDPWRLWNAPEHKGTPIALVAAAILAASPHNTQPWIFRIHPDRIELFAALERNLGAFDPFLREMFLGLGCALENMMQAAAQNGFLAIPELHSGSLLNLTTRSGLAPVATLMLTPHAAQSANPLYAAIPHRHTNRTAYERARGLPSATIPALAGAVDDREVKLFLYQEGAERQSLDSAIIDATDAIGADPEMPQASDAWVRTSPGITLRERSGLTYDAMGLSPELAAIAKLLPPLSASQNHDAWASQTRDIHVPTAPMLGIIAVKSRYDMPQTLKAGRLWQRLHLTLASLGVAAQPLNQPVEMVDRQYQQNVRPLFEAQLTAITKEPEWQPTFCFRFGIAKEKAPESPRRPLDLVIQS